MNCRARSLCSVSYRSGALTANAVVFQLERLGFENFHHWSTFPISNDLAETAPFLKMYVGVEKRSKQR